MKTKKYLFASVCIVLLFLLAFLFYVWHPVEVGMLPIGIISAIALIGSLVLLILAIKDMIVSKPHWPAVVGGAINVAAIVGIGYFFVVWLIIFIASI